MGHSKSVLFKAGNYLHPRYWPMWLIIGLLRLISFFPYKFQLKLGRMLGRLVHFATGSRQRIVDINLKRCFLEKSDSERNAIKSQCFQNIGISLIEMAICWWWPEKKLKSLVTIEGIEEVDKVLQSGRGAILLTGHFTSLEIGARLLALYMPVQVMYRTQPNLLFDSYLYTRRSSYFANTISRKNMRQMIKGIIDQIPTWYAPDQDFGREKNVFAPFMGISTATITASSRLVQSSGSAMLPYYPERKSDGSGYVLRIEPALEDFPCGDDLRDATTINASIEKFVRQYPQNYMWLHRRFKTRPSGEPAFYQ